ncbi:cysteine sulfinic acid decarboxylase [Condylostylus longicornis]|uniref:cysteine sulfinic acid decarboxylase n=1 Tax=Condylostylus longicornis TaxID=2530218 RepID=UPI00244E2BDF|nr:cysteine sulfinic acid decarboxylase [Condylostylus longicornis]
MPANGVLNLENEILQQNNLSTTKLLTSSSSLAVSSNSYDLSENSSSGIDSPITSDDENLNKTTVYNFNNNNKNFSSILNDKIKYKNKNNGTHNLSETKDINNKIYNNNNTKMNGFNNNNNNNKNFNTNNNNDDNNIPRWCSHPNRLKHEKFIRDSIDEIINNAVFDSTQRNSKVLEWHDPNELNKIFDMKLNDKFDSDENLIELIRKTIKYSVKAGHPYFINQLYSSLDPYALIGQWLTDALNPSVYTYEVSPVFILMEEMVLKEMRNIVGFPKYNNDDDNNGDGIFCPGGSIANGYAISCARYKYMPEIKTKGLSGLPRLVVYTSEDSHYSIAKLSSFMGIGIDNVYKIKTDQRGKMRIDHLNEEIERTKNEGGIPLLVVATAGTTVFGAYDPIEEISEICIKNNMWFHVDAAWGGGALLSQKYRHLLKGVEKADSVTWNPHKMLSSAQQCSTFLTRHKNILSECHSTNAAYLFQKDKFYDVKYDTGDKHIQCGRRADVLKFWFMWRAKGTDGLIKHVEHLFRMAEFFTKELKSRTNQFKLVLEEPECLNISFWYIPPSLRGKENDQLYNENLHKIAPKIKESMMKEGTMMVTYQSIKGIPNFFRLVLQNSVLNESDMLHFINEIDRLGKDL